MGGAFVAIADDASAVYWNPAGMVQIDHTKLEAQLEAPSMFQGADIAVKKSLNLDHAALILAGDFLDGTWGKLRFGFSMMNREEVNIPSISTLQLVGYPFYNFIPVVQRAGEASFY